MAEPAAADTIKLRATANDDFGATGFEQERVKSINDRIKLLKSILDEEKNRQPVEPSPPPMSPQMDPPSQESTPVMLPQETAQPPKVQDVTQQALIASDVATSTINSFELGYSLFMTGNFKAARSNFQALLKERQPPEETAWLNCFIGCCDRLQQDFDQAEIQFRNTVDEKHAPDVTAKYADWNLQYIAQRKQSIEAMKDISMQLEQILKETKSAR